MPRITEYLVLNGGDARDLASQVNARLAEGWQPYGDPFVHQSRLHQALARGETGKRIRKTSDD